MEDLHVAMRYQVVYSDSYFNSCKESVNEMIEDYCPNASFDNDYPLFADEIEVYAPEFKKMIGIVAELPDEEFNERYPDLSGMGREIAVKALKDIYENRDKENDYIKLSWF